MKQKVPCITTYYLNRKKKFHIKTIIKNKNATIKFYSSCGGTRFIYNETVHKRLTERKRTAKKQQPANKQKKY
jgi:hypothetical protein